MDTTPGRLVVHSMAWGLLLALLTLAIPRAEAIFADFGIPVPRITASLFRASRLAIAWPWLIVIPLLADWFVLDALSGRDDPRSSRAGP